MWYKFGKNSLFLAVKKVLPRWIINPLSFLRNRYFPSKQLTDYMHFMLKDVQKYYSTSYTQEHLVIHGQEHLMEAARKSGVIMGTVH